jgi:hypothetical protein
MAELIQRLNEDIAYVQQLGDNPNSDDGLTADQLKKWFDKAPVAIKEYLNTILIPQVEAKFGSIDSWIKEAGKKIDSFVVGSGFIPVDGSVPMSGSLNMNGNAVTNLPDPVNEEDAVNKGYADTIQKNVETADKIAVDAQKTADKKCAKVSAQETLSIGGWSGTHQMVNAAGVLADSTKCDVIVSPSYENREAYLDCEVRCIAQGDGTLTFTCQTPPETDLTVNVIALINQ